MSAGKSAPKSSLKLAVIALTVAIAGCTTVKNLLPFGAEDDEVSRSQSTSMHGAAGGPVMVLVDNRPVPFAPDAPGQYVVQRGDTLWDIAATFLRDPWYWPEVWYVNPQVENPHLIYPGDILAMVTIDGQQRITNIGESTDPGSIFHGPTYRVSPGARLSPLSESITSIPYEQIAAFLTKGVVIEKNQSDSLPYILATRGNHLAASAGNQIYMRGGREVPNGTQYHVIHIGDKLRDPDDNDVIGFLGIFVGEGWQSRGGDPATVNLTDTTREALEGDRLIPAFMDMPLNFFPKAPNLDVDGRIISVVDGVSLIGQYQVVILNRGARDGLAPGDVLSVFQTGARVRDRFENRSFGSGRSGVGSMVRLPEEQAGTVMIFKVYERIGYALVMEATSDIHVLDSIRNPS